MVHFKWFTLLQVFSFVHTHAVLCGEGDIRLIGGQTQLEGRVEVCLNETWGTVCENLWQNIDAGVACRQLGYSRYSTSTC